MRGVLAASMAAALLAGCANLLPEEDLVPNPPISPAKGAVFLFNGLTFSSEGNIGTGTYTLAENIRRLGVRAEIDRPSGWEAAAERVIGSQEMRHVPIAVYGYSYGARAGLRFAQRLEEAGISVQTVVVLEAYRPTPVPCNVQQAVHFYLSVGPLSQASLIEPARPDCGRAVVNRRYNPQGISQLVLNHWSVSSFSGVHREAQQLLLDGDRVRVHAF